MRGCRLYAYLKKVYGQPEILVSNPTFHLFDKVCVASIFEAFFAQILRATDHGKIDPVGQRGENGKANHCESNPKVWLGNDERKHGTVLGFSELDSSAASIVRKDKSPW